MKRFALMFCATIGILASQGAAQAGWGSLHYGGYQPWWNIFSCCKKKCCLTCEEERLQRFWHDYYHALKCYYCALDKIDWVAYYKNHGYQINTGCVGPDGCPRINYAPVFVSPVMQWAVPNSALSGPPVGPPSGCPPMGGPPMGAPMGMGGPPMGCPPGGCGGPGCCGGACGAPGYPR